MYFGALYIVHIYSYLKKNVNQITQQNERKEILMFHKVSQSKEKNFMVTKKVKFKKGSYNSGHKQQKNLN